MSQVSVEYSPVEEAAERRRSERTQLIVRVDYSTVDEIFAEFTSDINDGGLFIETESPQPTGTEVSMRFCLPGQADALVTTGRVIRVSQGGNEGPAGMGIEFDALDSDASGVINALIRSLRATPGSSGQA
jgi:uncharacterized protein (TIGR02266 family)